MVDIFYVVWIICADFLETLRPVTSLGQSRYRLETHSLDAHPKFSRKRPIQTMEMVGQRSSDIVDPFKKAITKRGVALHRFRRTGSIFSHTAYVSYWEEKVDNVLRHFSSEASLRKAVSIIRQYRPGTTNKEAFCSLAATDGSVTEAMGRLSDPEYRMEIQLVCKLLDLGKCCAGGFGGDSTIMLQQSTSSTTGLNDDPVLSVSGDTMTLHHHRRPVSRLTQRRTMSARTYRPSMMDISRTDLESLFTQTSLRSSTASCASGNNRNHNNNHPSARVAATTSLASLPSPRGCTGIPSRRALYSFLDTTLSSRKKEDLRELLKLSATVKERSRVYATPFHQRPFSSSGYQYGSNNNNSIDRYDNNHLATFSRLSATSSLNLRETSALGVAEAYSSDF